MKSVNPPDQLALVKAAQRGIISELKQVKYDVLDIF